MITATAVTTNKNALPLTLCNLHLGIEPKHIDVNIHSFKKALKCLAA